MFNKLKLRKAPLSLSSVSNVIKTAGVTDLSPSDINPKQIELSTISQLGIPLNSIVAIAYDPVQSLLAVSLKNNQVRVFGQSLVEVMFEFKTSSPITDLRFVKGVYLVCVQPAASNIVVLSLHSKEILTTYLAPGHITAVETDPSLDWLILGLSNGQLIFYDVDRLTLCPFKIDNLQKCVLPKHKLSPVLGIEWNPRDIGSVLITYSHCAVVYSITSGSIKSSFVYDLNRGDKGFEYSSFIANNGKKKLFGSSKTVIPEVKEAHFHPNGLHVVTVHQDNTLAFWDANDGKLLAARSIFETDLNKPGPLFEPPANGFGPILTVRWLAGRDPELTQLLISCDNMLHILDFGYTLKYSVSSYEKQTEFYNNPSLGQRMVPITFYESSHDSSITTIVPVSVNSQPYFNGNHNPSYLLLLSNNGALYIIQYALSGAASTVGTDLGGLIIPPTLSMVNPPILFSSVLLVKRILWYSIGSTRAATGASAKLKMLLIGGAAVNKSVTSKSMGSDENWRSVLITGHENGQVRFLDISQGEHQEPESALQVSLKETLFNDGNPNTLKVVAASCGFEGRELLVGLGNGDVVICKFGKSPRSTDGDSSGQDYTSCNTLHQNNDAKIIDIRQRVMGSFASASSFLPTSILRTSTPQEISFLKMSDIGFGAIGFKSGKLVVCDITRGPAVIFNEDLSQFVPSASVRIHATVIEFSIQEYGQDGYSSIMMYVGTNGGGNLLMFKIIPQGNGGFGVEFADKSANLNYRVLGNEDPSTSKIDQIIPVNAKTGELTIASNDMFQRLSTGIVIPGFIVTGSNRDIRVIKPPKTKLAHKVIDDTCLRCGIVHVKTKGIVLASLVKTGFIKFSALPSLSDITDIKLPKDIYEKIKQSLESQVAYGSEILGNGQFFIKLSGSELVSISAALNEHKIKKSSGDKGPTTDLLFNENAIIPPRPTVSAMQWAKGNSKYVSVEDLTFLIAGPNRRPAKHAESRLAYNISPEANPNQSYGADVEPTNSKGYIDPVRKSKGGGGSNPYSMATTGFMRNIQSGFESMEETVNSYAVSMNEAMQDSISDQKRSLYGAAVKSKFGF